jgi:hypothetical protein
MGTLIATIALPALVVPSAANAQTAGSPNPAPPSTNPNNQLVEHRTGWPPPAAHRSSPFGEKLDGSERSSRENAALERIIEDISHVC